MGGLVYVVASLAFSGVHLAQIHPSLTNDYWWPDFNSTGLQSFIGDVYNVHLGQSRRGDFPLVGQVYSTKSYGDNNTRMEWSASYGRQLLLDDIPLAIAVNGLRMVPLELNFMMVAPYCWLDINRSFAMAHTFKRQRRCEATKQSNAALYFEAMTRNCAANAMYTSTERQGINGTILASLRLTIEGQWWIQAMETHEYLSIDDEVSYWTSRGLTKWKTPVQNLNHDGIDDSIAIRNALGYEQTIQIKKVSRVGRSLGRWTTLAAYDGIWNDIDICQSIDASVLLYAHNSFANLGIDWDVDVLGPPNTVGGNLVRQFVGPFLSIDVERVSVPPMLRVFHRAFQESLRAMYKQHYNALLLAVDTSVDPVPRTWHRSPSTLYYGGNPLCPFGEGKPYIQPSFGYYDDCTAQIRHSLRVSLEAALFALHVSPLAGPDMILNSCNLCTDTVDDCARFFLSLQHIDMALSCPTSVALLQEAEALHIAFIQLASDNGSNFMLSQSMVPPDTADPWTLFGWVMMYDWLQGDREAYNFEGDNGNVTILSQPHPVKFSMVANPQELPSHACKYIWYIAVYITFTLTGVGVVLAVYAWAYRFQFPGRHLLEFNRVVGSVWIGRPMLFLRGMTALVVLSTAPVTFDYSGGLSTLQYRPRMILETCLLAGEGTWLTYVLQDVFTPVTRRAGWFVSASSIVVWGVLLVLDQAGGVQVASVIHPNCVVRQLGLQISCHSGVVEIGSSSRFHLLVGVCVVVPGVLWAVAWMSSTWTQIDPVVVCGNRVLAPAAATSFLRLNDGEGLEPVTSVMCGLLHLPHDVIFDIKLWRRLPQERIKVENGPHANSLTLTPTSRRRMFGLACLGLVYMASTVVVSYGYLELTKSTMVNDVWWSSFNDTGHQTFLTNWFSNQLLLSHALDATHIDQVQYGDITNKYDTNQTSITTAPMYPASIQDQVYSDLHAVVLGLRGTPSCDLPWIASSYCFVDFDQSWEMAVSADRQLKCKQLDATNGAVYLESILRNANWATMEQCWGGALQTGVFDHLQATSKGQAWVVAMTSLDAKVPVPDEVAAWLSFHVTTYSPHWQNYKQMGITETALIQNAFGLAYPFTIRKLLPTYQSLSTATSFRMQWPLARLLWGAMFHNVSSGKAGSLVRSSPQFAFSNSSSVEGLLARNGTLAFPLNQGLALTRAMFGPFGTTSMKRIAPPLALRSLYRSLIEAILTCIGENATAMNEFMSIQLVYIMSPGPTAWQGQGHLGGNFMCGLSTNIEPSIAQYFALDGSCSVNGIEEMTNTMGTTMAALLAHTSIPPEATCIHDTHNQRSCNEVLVQGVAFFASAMLPSQRTRLANLAETTKRTIQTTYSPQLFQYTSDSRQSNKVVLSHVSVFDDPTFDFFAWLYMFEWVLGYREVVQFDGEFTSLTVVSGRPLNIQFEVNALEIPQNVAYYVRWAIQYFTLVMLVVAVVVTATIVAARGHIEGRNMFKLNRVAGLVWIGRPLMLLRGITATCILSTASLELVQRHVGLTQLTSTPPNPITTMLSCGEMGWVVYLLNDVFSVVTADATVRYAWKSSVMVWLAAGVWSLVAPVQHVVRVDRQCVVKVVDFSLACQSGVFEIGSVQRFAGLLVLAGACCAGCYLVERMANVVAAKRASSVLLHAVAQYQFNETHWNHGGVYYVDRASAVLNGMLSFRTSRGAFVVMDVKTWQVMVIPPIQPTEAAPHALASAIPLVD
ncbi:hypothetical protein DYB37_005357 [Aphanomyces astaci]|uniref:Uncharacterized protein n=1 Tax=Aphanomyces astaci TaxID=112090 RepID=A0A3R7BZD3_APHAT|nr:hypothetical protein DYB37_005357 [Aphanomyces astaci]